MPNYIYKLKNYKSNKVIQMYCTCDIIPMQINIKKTVLKNI